MSQAPLCPSSGDRLYKTASGVSLDVLAAVVWSQDTSWAQHCVQLVSQLHSTAAGISTLTPDAVLYSLSPDDGHNDAQNMLS